jgi:hypothetical protein
MQQSLYVLKFINKKFIITKLIYNKVYTHQRLHLTNFIRNKIYTSSRCNGVSSVIFFWYYSILKIIFFHFFLLDNERCMSKLNCQRKKKFCLHFDALLEEFKRLIIFVVFCCRRKFLCQLKAYS